MSINFEVALNIPDIEILKVEKNKVDDLISDSRAGLKAA